MDLRDRHGRAVAYIHQNDIVLFNGVSVAHIRGDVVYGFNGRHLGHFTDGWISDMTGRQVLYTAQAQGRLVRPINVIASVKSVRQVPPIKSVPNVPYVRPVTVLGWSDSDATAWLMTGR